MGIVQTVLIVLVCLVVLYLIVNWFFKTSTQLTSMGDGKTSISYSFELVAKQQQYKQLHIFHVVLCRRLELPVR